MLVPGANTVKDSGSIAGSIRVALNAADRCVQSVWGQRMTSELTGSSRSPITEFPEARARHWDRRDYFTLSQQEQLVAPQRQGRAHNRINPRTFHPGFSAIRIARRDLGTLCLDGDFPRSGHSVDLNFPELALLSFLLAKSLTSSNRIRLYFLVRGLFRTLLELNLKHLSPWALGRSKQALDQVRANI